MSLPSPAPCSPRIPLFLRTTIRCASRCTSRRATRAGSRCPAPPVHHVRLRHHHAKSRHRRQRSRHRSTAGRTVTTEQSATGKTRNTSASTATIGPRAGTSHAAKNGARGPLRLLGPTTTDMRLRRLPRARLHPSPGTSRRTATAAAPRANPTWLPPFVRARVVRQASHTTCSCSQYCQRPVMARWVGGGRWRYAQCCNDPVVCHVTHDLRAVVCCQNESLLMTACAELFDYYRSHTRVPARILVLPHDKVCVGGCWDWSRLLTPACCRAMVKPVSFGCNGAPSAGVLPLQCVPLKLLHCAHAVFLPRRDSNPRVRAFEGDITEQG